MSIGYGAESKQKIQQKQPHLQGRSINVKQVSKPSGKWGTEGRSRCQRPLHFDESVLIIVVVLLLNGQGQFAAHDLTN